MTDAKHPGAPRDIDLDGWLDGVGFHPANTERKQRGHEAARLLVGLSATALWDLLPPGRDKSIVFTHLEDVLIRSNRALALGQGPKETMTDETIAAIIQQAKDGLASRDAVVPYDPRIHEYEAEQRGEPTAVQPLEPFEYRVNDGPSYLQLDAGVVALASTDGSGVPRPAARIALTRGASADGLQAVHGLYIEDPEKLEELAAYLLASANQLRAIKARNVESKNHGDQLLSN